MDILSLVTKVPFWSLKLKENEDVDFVMLVNCITAVPPPDVAAVNERA
jgi:hypothetical protein